MDLNIANEIIYWSRRSYERNLICATGGNISVRIPGTNTMMIKASGESFADLTIDDIVLVDLEGNLLEGNKVLSKEWRFHAGIYQHRPEIGAVVHVHPPFATAIANSMDHLPLATNHAKVYLKNVPNLPIGASGSLDLAVSVINAFKNSDINSVLMEEHGIISTHASLKKAFYLAEMLEDTAKIVICSKVMAL